MIYLNNAATTYPKPQCVLTAHAAALCALPASQYRTMESTGHADVFTQCRENLGHLLHIRDTERIFFSSGATDSANRLILGLPCGTGKIITTKTEHNSILRPLMNHPLYKERLLLLSCDSRGMVDLKPLEQLEENEGSILFLNHCSNVTGAVQDLSEARRITKEKGILLIVDLSQSAGCIPLDVDALALDGVIFTGHKGLYGIQGTGGYYVNRNADLKPVFYGGTGRNSSQLTYEDGSYEYEVGTQNAPGIAALNAGVEYLLEMGVEKIYNMEQHLMRRLYTELGALALVTLYDTCEAVHGPLMSFNIQGLKPSDAAYILQNGYEIVVRAGLHCAPLIHEAMGTENAGTIRVSVGMHTTEAEISALVLAVKEICDSIQSEG